MNTDVPFSDGSTSKSKTYGEISTGPRPGGRIGVDWPVELDPAALGCPPGQGPCMLVLIIKVRCPDGCCGGDEDLQLFCGPIKC